MANYKDWIDAIGLNVDYFSAFMKAWIAFNSWYDSEEVEGRTDKDKIDFIANRTNRFKTYMNNLLVEETSEGISFRESVAFLHASLASAAITTQEYFGMRQTISFSEVAVKNLNTIHEFDYRKLYYACYRAGGKIHTIITSRGGDVFRYEQEEDNEDALKQQATFAALSSTQQNKCLVCYAGLRPYINESVLYTGETAKKMGAYCFMNDDNKISRAIIMILYLLRCALAHGDVSPDESSNKVYRYAYEVLVLPLKKLR